jgi:hypothetical protein
MTQEVKRAELVARVAKTLHGLKHPFFFEQDTVFGPDTSVDKWLGTGGNEARLRNEMRAALTYCDSLGFRFVQMGSVSLAIILFAESLSNEAAIGRSVVIQSSMEPFIKFDRRSGWAFPFYANIFYIFGSSEKAFGFRNVAQDKCKHLKVGLLRAIHIKPWCIDFQGKHVAAPKAPLSGLDKEPSEIESKLFDNA